MPLNVCKKLEKDSNLKIIQNVYNTKLGERRFENLTDDEFFEIETKPNEEHFKVIAVDPGDTRLIHGVTNKVIFVYIFFYKN